MSSNAKPSDASNQEANSSSEEVPSSLSGGILLDQGYLTSLANLNNILFGAGSSFRSKIAALDGTLDLSEDSWSEQDGHMRRIVSYTKVTRSLPKGFKTTEQQAYLRSDGRVFAVLVTVSTPDVPFGGCFLTEILYCGTQGTNLPNGEETSHLKISWKMNFVKRTIMKGFIEGRARQELKENYETVAKVLAEFAKPFDPSSLRDPEKLESGTQVHYERSADFGPDDDYSHIRVSLVILVCFLVHTFVDGTLIMQALRSVGIDLPDCLGQLITGSLLVWQLKRFIKLLLGFMENWFAREGNFLHLHRK